MEDSKAEQKERKKKKLKKIEADYKRFNEELTSVNRDEDPEIICNLVTEHLKMTDELYPQIQKKLIGSAADAKHLKNLIKLSKSTAKRINTPVKFDVGRALRSLKRELGDPEKLKENLMRECVTKCFMVAPTFEFFYGAIKQENMQIKQRRKRLRADNANQNAVAVQAAEKNLETECEQDTTPKEVEAIYKKVKQLLRPGSRKSVALIPTLVDPDSFPQTVENIFHTAFLVKEGKVGITRDEDNQPALTHEDADETMRPTQRREQSSQSIFSFSMTDYRKWIGSNVGSQLDSTGPSTTRRRAITNGHA